MSTFLHLRRLFLFAAPPRGRRRFAAALIALLIGLAGLGDFADADSLTPGRPASDPRRIEPAYWRERIFFIPFQPDPQQFLAGSTREVRLLISRDGVSWNLLQQARPEVRGFSYHAPGDGEYYFAVQVVDASGRLTPPTITEPQLRVVVDGAEPELRLEAVAAAAGAAAVRYDIRDPQLAAESLQIEVREGAGPWRSVQVGPPDLQRPGRLRGQVTWGPATGSAGLTFRAVVRDRAGNTATAETTVGSATSADPEVNLPLSPPAMPYQNDPGAPAADDGPSLGPATAGLPSDSFRTPSLLPNWGAVDSVASASPPQEWPASNAPATFARAHDNAAGPLVAGSNSGWQTGTNSAGRPAPPPENSYSPYSSQSDPAAPRNQPDNSLAAAPALSNNMPRSGRTVFGSDPFAASDRTVVDEAASRPLAAPPVLPSHPSSPFAFAASATPVVDPPAQSGINWAGNGGGPGGELPAGAMQVNSRTFDVEYDVATAGDWGVARVELWGTADNGATWSNFAVDSDSRSPVRVTTPGAGLFGMRIVVHGANAAALPPPAAGARPELYVYVDLYPPGVNLLGAERGEGDQADQLRIRWAASDSHLSDRPITILYSSYETGPWSTAAANLENTGEFFWRLQRHLPDRLFLRIEATDQAGNVGVAESKNPVAIEAPQPVGHLRGVRPSTPASPTVTSPFGG
ncbi:MAG: hypothetical protein KDA44_04110 [Planctomycetales bacterium]|nr:hypothetical protein [Planctomycetales bacterium]